MTTKGQTMTDASSTTLISVRQAAGRLGVSPDTVRRRIAAGELPALRIGYRTVRIAESALREYIDSRPAA